MAEKYMKKAIVVEAMQVTRDSITAVARWVEDNIDEYLLKESVGGADYYLVRIDPDLEHFTITIPTPDGTVTAQLGDYVIRGIKNEFYPCKPDIFAKLYTGTSQMPDEPKVDDLLRSFEEKGYKKIRELHNVSARKNIPDLEITGRKEWVLVCKASSKSQNFIKSTKVMDILNGCLVQVTTYEQGAIAEALTYVPGAKLSDFHIDEE